MSAPLPLIPDADKPLSQRRYPFRAARPEEEPEVRAAIDAVLKISEGLLWEYAYRFWPHACREILEDEVQLARVHLFEYSLPRFDATRHSKVTTFACACIAHFFMCRARSEMRKRRRTRSSNILDYLPSPSTGSDRQIEQLAEQIRANPENYMSKRQAEVFVAIQARGDTQELRQIAREVGYANPSSISMIQQRIRQSICRAAQELY